MPHTATLAPVPAPTRTRRTVRRGARPKPVPEPVLARIERAGPAACDDHELLALLGIELDAPTLTAAGGLRALLDDPDDRLGPVALLPAHRARLHAVLELHARWMKARLKREGPFTSPAHTARFITARIRGRANEVFACLFLDNRHRVIAFEETFQGSIDGASVHPRVVARRALAHNAAALVCAHNHPSGVAEPSRSDRAITARLRDALALVDVRLLDHFVVGDGECVSFAERGWL